MSLAYSSTMFIAAQMGLRFIHAAPAAYQFDVSATGYPEMHSQGLAAGASRTYKSGTGCNGGTIHAVVDPGNLVKESNEDNNTADAQQIC